MYKSFLACSVMALAVAVAVFSGSQSADAQRFRSGGSNQGSNDNDKKDDKDKKDNKNQGSNNGQGGQGTSGNQGGSNNNGNSGNSGSNSNNQGTPKKGGTTNPLGSNPPTTGGTVIGTNPTGGNKTGNSNNNGNNNKPGSSNNNNNPNNNQSIQQLIQGRKDRDSDRDRDRNKDRDRDDNDPTKVQGTNRFFNPNQPNSNKGVVIGTNGPSTVDPRKFGYWNGNRWEGSRKADNWNKAFGNNQKLFSKQWYDDHPRAWRWDDHDRRSNVWVVATVPGVYSWLGWGAVPQQYQVNYGPNYRFNPDDYNEWYPLGVYSMMNGPDDMGTRVVQLAVDRHGHLNGTYYDMITDNSYRISGDVSQQSQRAQWTLNTNPNVRFSCNMIRLLQPEGTINVELPNGQQRWQFVRMED